jgi:hypothetical protein
MNFKSRKTIILIVAILVSIFGFLKTDFKLEGNPAEAVGAIGVALLYVFGQAKLDIKRAWATIGDNQKFRDPAFWIAMIGVIIAPINEVLGANIPVEAIQGFAAIIVPILIGVLFKKTPSTPIA